MKKQIIAVAILILFVGVGMFFAGIKFARKTTPIPAVVNTKQVATENINIPERSGVASGEVVLIDAESMVLKLKNGDSKKIKFSESVAIRKNVEGQISDVVIGQDVSVTGESNDDGIIEAKNISIKPLVKNAQ